MVPAVVLEKKGGKWSPILASKFFVEVSRGLRKGSSLSGPIDQAFTDQFLCVRGTGKAWHAGTQQYAEANLKRFQYEWSKYFRGELSVKNDTELTALDENRNLVLFGDPSSNSLIRQSLDWLPLHWDRERITFAGKSYSANSHVPVMIFPSPFSTSNYVVLNSGHTFHAPDFEGTNALLYPRLGDYAILKLTPTEEDPLAVEVVTAGLFDEKWQVPKSHDPSRR
jgi:hypothetical protein